MLNVCELSSNFPVCTHHSPTNPSTQLIGLMTIKISHAGNTVISTVYKRASTTKRFMHLILFSFAAVVITACSDDDNDGVMTPATPAPTVITRDSGLVVTVQDANGIKVHSLTAPEAVFANSTHIIETENSLIAFDTQFLLPNAADMRAYADEIGKPIDRVFITHDHPDHFLGSEAFNDRPVFALQEVADLIEANGDAEVAEKQVDFGPDNIAGTYVVPQVVAPGSLIIDGVTFELERVVDAEAAFQLVARIPNHGVVVTGDLVYSGVHLILAGQVVPWTTALQNLDAVTGYPIVLAGHGVPAVPEVYDTNIRWLAKAGELIASVGTTAASFKQGLIDAFPDLGMPAAIDFVTPILFPANPTTVTQAVNLFINSDVTGGVPLTVDVQGPATIGEAVEFPGFAFGTYDVDASPSQLTMTLATDPETLQVGTYDSETRDLYYYEFDIPVATAAISNAADGFVATVQIMSPGDTATSDGTFVDGLATSFTFENGGILVTIGDGSALRTVGQGGSFTVDLTF